MMSSSRKFLLQKRFNFVDSESRNSFRLRNATSSRICESSRSSRGSSRSRARKIRRSSKNWFRFVERDRLRKRGRTTSDRNCFWSAETSGRMLDHWKSRKSFDNLKRCFQIWFNRLMALKLIARSEASRQKSKTEIYWREASLRALTLSGKVTN